MGCGADESVDGDDATTQQPLYESASIDKTALMGLKQAQTLTFDPLFGGIEYCGVIFKDSASQFSAAYPTTSGSRTICRQSYSSTRAAVGFYHSHPAGVENKFSDEDKAQAKLKDWVYYLVASDNCRYRYDWRTGKTSVLGCG